MPTKRAIFVGVDPGLTGAIGIIDQDSRCIAVIDVATKFRDISKTRIKKEFDVKVTADRLTDRIVNYLEYEWHGCIEMPFSIPAKPGDPNSGSNVMSMNSLFQTYGGLLAMLEMVEIETMTIRPSDWKRGFGLTKSKNLSLEIAANMWPTAGIVLKKQHNQAEALLMAEYARLTWKRQQMEAKR